MHETVARALFDREVPNLLRLAKLRGWKVYQSEFPVMDVGFVREGGNEFRLRGSAPHWNSEPPSFALLRPDGERLGSKQIPRFNVFHAGPHRHTGHPFVCMIGSLEYHTHENHLTDPWESYRGKDNYTFVAIINQIWNAWLKAPA